MADPEEENGFFDLGGAMSFLGITEEQRAKMAERTRAVTDPIAAAANTVLTPVGEAAGDAATAVGDFYNAQIKAPINTYAIEPMREQAGAIEQASDPFLGGATIDLASLVYDLAPEQVGGFLPEQLQPLAPIALDALQGQDVEVLKGGLADKTVAERYDLATNLGQQFGFSEDIAAMQQQLPMNEFRTLLGPGGASTDADAIQRIMSQLGVEISELKEMITPKVFGGKAAIKTAAPKTMGLLDKLEAVQKAETDKERAAALERLKRQIAKLGENGEYLRRELNRLHNVDVAGFDVGEMIDDALKDTGVKFDTILEAIQPLVNVTEGMLNDNEEQLKRGIDELSDVAPEAYRAYQEHNLNQMNLVGDELVEAQAQNKLIGNVMEQVMVLASGDASDIKRIVEGQNWEQILKETPIAENAAVVSKAAGELAAEGKISEETLPAVNRVVGDEITDSLVSNPLLMTSLFAGGAFAFGGLGRMLGGEDSMMQGLLPMMAPLLMRAGLGEDEYAQGIGGIESTLGQITDPIFQPIFNMLPEELYNVPLLGGILKGYRDSPLQLTTALTGALTGNRALKQASLGLGLSNFIFGESNLTAMARTPAAMGPAGSPIAPSGSPVTPAVTAQSSVGDTTINADMNMVLGEQIHALDVFSIVGQRTIQ